MAKINYEGLTGETRESVSYGDFTIDEYLGKDEKKRHRFNITFRTTGNKKFNVDYQVIRTGKVIDEKEKKRLSSKKKAEKNREKYKFFRKNVERYSKKDNDKFVMAIDLSTVSTGVSLWAAKEHINTYCITPNSILKARDRVNFVVDEINKLCRKAKPNIIVIEDIFLGTNVQVLVTLAEARGQLLRYAISHKIRVEIIAAKTYRSGLGAPDYSQIKHLNESYSSVLKKWSMNLMYKDTGGMPATNDESDAYCLGKWFVK